MLYRLVGQLRQRTLDAIECIAAWKRKTRSPEPFIYYGNDYLGGIGQDLKASCGCRTARAAETAGLMTGHE